MAKQGRGCEVTTKLTVIRDGITEEVEMGEEFMGRLKALAEWDGWCKCDRPETGRVTMRGHSADVDCANCGGALQVG